MLDVPGVAGRRPGQVEAGPAVCVLVRRELAGDHGAGALEAAHRLRVLVGDTADAGLRASGGQHAFGVVDVLERNRHPVQGTAAAARRDLRVRRSRRRERALGHDRHMGAESRVVRRDAFERGLDEIEGGQLPGRNHACAAGEREVCQIDHVSLSSGAPTVGARPFCPRALARGRRHDRTREGERRPCLRLPRAGADPENQPWCAGVGVRAKRSNLFSSGRWCVTARPPPAPRRGGRGSPRGRSGVGRR